MIYAPLGVQGVLGILMENIFNCINEALFFSIWPCCTPDVDQPGGQALNLGSDPLRLFLNYHKLHLIWLHRFTWGVETETESGFGFRKNLWRLENKDTNTVVYLGACYLYEAPDVAPGAGEDESVERAPGLEAAAPELGREQPCFVNSPGRPTFPFFFF